MGVEPVGVRHLADAVAYLRGELDIIGEATTRDALRSRGVDPAALPLNRVPYLRIALGAEHINASEKITIAITTTIGR